MKIPLRFYYGNGTSKLRFYCPLAVSATIRRIFDQISNRSGIAVQWNVCLTEGLKYATLLICLTDSTIVAKLLTSLSGKCLILAQTEGSVD